MKPLLEVKGLTISHHNSILVDNVSFTIHKDQRLAIVGQSGSGKSLTVSAIGCLLPHSLKANGQVLWQGNNLLTMQAKEIRKLRKNGIATILQESMSCLNPSMKIGKQIKEIAPDDDPLEWLEAVEIPSAKSILKAYPHECSGGMRQRITIAIVLASKPQLLLADEMTSALDHTTQEQILNLMDNVCSRFNIAIACITHDIAVAERLCSHILVMHEGKVIEEGQKEIILQNPTHTFTKHLIACSSL